MKALAIMLALAAPLHAQFTPPGCGDADYDGRVTILDALITAQIAVGLAPLSPRHIRLDVAPPYGMFTVCLTATTPIITVLDAVVIAQYAAGSRPALVCQCVP